MLYLPILVLALCIASSEAVPSHKRQCLRKGPPKNGSPTTANPPPSKTTSITQTVPSSPSSTAAITSPKPKPSPAEDSPKSKTECPKPTTPASTPGFALRSSYIDVKFGQSKAIVDASVKGSFDRLLSTVKDGGFGDVVGWTAQNGWTVVAQYDAVHKSRTFEKQVSAAQTHLKDHSQTECNWQKPFVNCYNDDNGWAALALIQAYESYGDQKYLDWAKGIFEFTLTHGYIQKADLDAGKIVGTDQIAERLVKDCNGKSMLGGVTWRNSGQTNVNAVSTGLFALMAAKLCQHLKDNGYCNHGYLAAQWLDRHMVTSGGLLVDNIGPSSCKITDWKFTYNAGLYIAGYSLLGSLTGNDTAIGLAARTARESINTPQWNNDQGIIKEGAGSPGRDDGIGFKAVLIRSLLNSYRFFDKSLQTAIIDYVNIQYYAVTQLNSDDSKKPTSYGRNWAGPNYDPKSWTPQTQLTALDVLNAITLNADAAYPVNSDASSNIMLKA